MKAVFFWRRHGFRRANVVLALLALLLQGCQSGPQRPYVAMPQHVAGCGIKDSGISDKLVTPEITSSYTLHFLEFDDQGWAYPDAGNKPAAGSKNSSETQIDCAIADLANRMRNKKPVRSFVFIHGWHHSAADNDRDLNRFRKFLDKMAQSKDREVVGFYIAWAGQTIDMPIVEDTTFWSRKNAAHHVSEGSVREFFSRIKALRNYWNDTDVSPDCRSSGESLAAIKCPLRTVMMGHSFGGLILFSATSPYLLETLAGTADLPAGSSKKAISRERGIADMVILLNPAFEATRYDAVFRAAQRYNNAYYEPPLLVTITSTADTATKTAFPIARFFNSILQYPSESEDESIAMRNTHGHIPRYITHVLSEQRKDGLLEAHDADGHCLDSAGNRTSPRELADTFFKRAINSNGYFELTNTWQREFCGGVMLSKKSNPGTDPYNVVWNIQTDSDFIPDHNAITGDIFVSFVRELYGDFARVQVKELQRNMTNEANAANVERK